MRTVYLREFLPASGAGGPLHPERIALDRQGVIPIRRHGPRLHGLAALLLNGAEFEKRCRRVDGHADLFSKFADGGCERIFARLDLTFGNRPMAGVLVDKE